MSGIENIVFAPVFDAPFLYGAGLLVLGLSALALWRGLSGWWLRLLAGGVLILALLNPQIREAEFIPLKNTVIILRDVSDSQSLKARASQTDRAVKALLSKLSSEAMAEDFTVIDRVISNEQGEKTTILRALDEAMTGLASDRIAGLIIVSDGQIADMDDMKDFPAPVHLILSGERADWDRRLVLNNVPAYGIVGETVEIGLTILAEGPQPQTGRLTSVDISIDGADPQRFEVPINEALTLPVKMAHGGKNTVQITVPPLEGELTNGNNSEIIEINGVRDRLRVLLVSGEPYPGERTWRNLLKSDLGVDLVHFTILRAPEDFDGVPQNELSLIPFPTQELFIDKIDQFDLIIFDRYRRRGILNEFYFDNIARYVEDGGALFVATGPGYSSVNSIAFSALGRAIPARPTGRVMSEKFKPALSEDGKRHPVTRDLPNGENWGSWYRLIEADVEGDVLMTGPNEEPLLTLARMGEGRVAVLLTDQSWLWARGHEGGGPHHELLRRISYWLMKQYELEEERLDAAVDGQSITITGNTLSDRFPEVTMISPDGSRKTLNLTSKGSGLFEAQVKAEQFGTYRLTAADLSTVAILGQGANPEFAEVMADASKSDAVRQKTGGGLLFAEDTPTPDLRVVKEGQASFGRNWLGVVDRESATLTNLSEKPLFPAWLYLLFAVAFMLGAWLREGRWS